MATNKSENKKAMDVAKPGGSVPDASSRPILVTARPMIQDPMMKSNDKSAETPSVESEKPSTTPATKPTEPANHGDKVIQPISEKSGEEDKAEAEEVPAPPEPEPENEKTEEEAVVDAVAGEAEISNTKKEAKKNEAEIAKQEALAKLVAEKKYFLPIGQVTRRRHNRHALITLLLLIIISAAGAYVLIDAGIVKAPIELPFHIIKQSDQSL